MKEEQDKIFRLIYKQVAFDVKAKWEMVGAHVQQQRLLLWEAQEEAKRQQRLQEKLEWSENMVARQRGEADGDSNEEDVVDSNEDEDEESGEENMSQSSSEVGDEEEAGGGEMDEDELAAYLAQRKAEPPDKDEQEEEEAEEAEEAEEEEEEEGEENGIGVEEQEEAGDVSMADVSRPDSRNDEDKDTQDVSTADMFSAEAEADDAPDEEFQPKNEEGEELQAQEASTNAEQHARRSRRSSASPAIDEENAEGEFSSDDSTDMDSEDYDSDEDMRSTGEEDNADAEEDGSDQESSGERPIPRNSLLSLFKDEVRATQLPTPTTSAEGDEREHHVESSVEEPVDVQAEAGAAAENVSVVPGVEEMEPTPRIDVEGDMTSQVSERDIQAVEGPITASAPQSPAPETEADALTKYMVPSPVLLHGTLRSYQHAGLDWLASLYRNGTNGILADEMGLGKTIQTIALLAHLAEEHDCWETHLVVVPTSVILNWVTEFQKFLPGFRVLGYYGTAEERQAKRRGWVNDPHHENREKRGYNVVITSYNVAMQDINAIRNVQWHYLVLDEAHNIRNFNSQRWQVLIRLKTKARLLLTGTPLQNSLTELWSLLTFLTAGDDDPQHGDLEEFLSHWKEPVKEIFDRGVQSLSHEAQKVVDQLHVSLRPFLLRRLKIRGREGSPDQDGVGRCVPTFQAAEAVVSGLHGPHGYAEEFDAGECRYGGEGAVEFAAGVQSSGFV